MDSDLEDIDRDPPPAQLLGDLLAQALERRLGRASAPLALEDAKVQRAPRRPVDQHEHRQGAGDRPASVFAVTDDLDEIVEPVWLPGDAGIAFLAGAIGPEISVMRRDGTDVHRLALQGTEQFTWVDAPLPQQRCRTKIKGAGRRGAPSLLELAT